MDKSAIAVGGALFFAFGTTVSAIAHTTPAAHEIAAFMRRASGKKHEIRRASRIHKWDRDLAAEPTHGYFKRLYHVRVTAYIPRAEGIEGGRYTSTQRDGQASHGIAVDPHIIPLGTRLWIPGYGHGVADDIGSAIQGHHIDIRVQDRGRMLAWGSRDLKVYVLDDPRNTP